MGRRCASSDISSQAQVGHLPRNTSEPAEAALHPPQPTARPTPSPNTLSTASTPPAKGPKVLPMCPVRFVTYLSGRAERAIVSLSFLQRQILAENGQSRKNCERVICGSFLLYLSTRAVACMRDYQLPVLIRLLSNHVTVLHVWS